MSRLHLKRDQHHFENLITPYAESLINQGYVVGKLRGFLNGAEDVEAWKEFQESWDDLVPDQYMGDGGHYRQRRYSVFGLVAGAGVATIIPDQRHYQTLDYNPLNGGIYREYPPFSDVFLSNPIFLGLLDFAGSLVQDVSPEKKQWRIEGHQFRILTSSDETGKPTPEGIHKDGTDFVFITLVNREAVKGGVSRVYSGEGKLLTQKKLRRPLDFMLVNDRTQLHYVTPIKPLREQHPGHRDVLVLTFRAVNDLP